MMQRSLAHLRLLALAVLLGGALAVTTRANHNTGGGEKFPLGAKLVRIEAEPTAIHLQNPFAYTQLVLRGYLDNGDIVDLTRSVRPVQEQSLVSVSERGLVPPRQDGRGTLEFVCDGRKVAVPVEVSGQKQKYHVSFVQEVMPALSKMGCNSGTCHGSAQGRNGFQLSLRGYDPLFDHRALTDDHQARRFNRAAPDKSLMLMKPSGEVPHTGGVITRPGEPYHEMLRLWIAEGVKLDLNAPRVTEIAILPSKLAIPLPGMKQQMRVLATCADGSQRDVSAEAFLDSSNIEVATVDKQGLVTAVRRGEVAIMARYEGAYAATPLVVMGDRSGFVWQPVPESNYIDTLVYDKLKQVKVLPSPLCSDAEFVRRLYLDLTGLPPEPDAVRAFLADARPSREKRDALIDQLIGNTDFLEHWTNKWCDLLQCNAKFLGNQGAQVFRDWIRKAVADNRPYDKFAYELLTASGSTMENPPVAYFKILRDPGAAMENTTHLFMAVRFNCNKCHDHPFERWTQDQYYQLAAYFAQIEHKADPKYKGQQIGGTDVEKPKPLVEIIQDKASGEVAHVRTGETANPKFPFTLKEQVPGDLTRRQQLARWITSTENPYFAKSHVNRIWSYLLGPGLIEPVDDIRAGNPPTNPQLLQKLTDEFIHSGFNTRELMRVICKSRTYQHSIQTNRWNKDDDVNYSHAMARRLPAEVLYDSIHKVTGSLSKLPGLAPGARAAQLLDPRAPIPGGFLDQFGKPARESACECERSNSMLLGPVLNLVNGPVLSDALRDPNNRIHQLCAKVSDDAKLVGELFLAILCRPPTAEEMNWCLAEFHNSKDSYAKLIQEQARRVAKVKAREAELDKLQPAWEADLKNNPVWVVLEPDEVQATGGTTLTKQLGHSVLASGDSSTPETYVITVKTKLDNISAYRLELLPDASLPQQGPGRGPDGNFVLSEFKVFFSEDGDPQKFKPVKLNGPKATFSQQGFAIGQAIDGKPATGWGIAPQTGKTHLAAFDGRPRIGKASGGVLKFELLQQHSGKQHTIGRFRLWASTQKSPVPLQSVHDTFAKILDTAPAMRTKQEQDMLTTYYRSKDAELSRRQKEAADLLMPADARVMVAQDIAWALMNSPAFLFNH